MQTKTDLVRHRRSGFVINGVHNRILSSAVASLTPERRRMYPAPASRWPTLAVHYMVIVSCGYWTESSRGLLLHRGVIDAISFCLVCEKQMRHNAVNASRQGRLFCVWKSCLYIAAHIFLLRCSVFIVVDPSSVLQLQSVVRVMPILFVCPRVCLHTRKLCRNCVTYGNIIWHIEKCH